MHAAPAADSRGFAALNRFMPRLVVALLALGAGLGLSACASFPKTDPLQVTVAGIEPMQGEGLELRMLVKLRVQNPNDAPVDYDGAFVKLSVQDKTFATGVSDARGSVPRFGESVVAVPVTISMLNVVKQVFGAMDPKSPPSGRIRYTLEGKLNGTGFGSHRFTSQGELQLPATPTTPDGTAR
jgi:LEA14-like dessication related protein